MQAGKKFIVAVRSTLKLEVPIADAGKMLVDDSYIAHLINISNTKLKENFKRIKKFFSACRICFLSDISTLQMIGNEAAPPIITAMELSSQHSLSIHGHKNSATCFPGVDTPSGELSCTICKQSFLSRNKLYKHIQSAHPSTIGK